MVREARSASPHGLQAGASQALPFPGLGGQLGRIFLPSGQLGGARGRESADEGPEMVGEEVGLGLGGGGGGGGGVEEVGVRGDGFYGLGGEGLAEGVGEVFFAGGLEGADAAGRGKGGREGGGGR